jgi:transcriptional regulator with XRE-family HTH domain
LIEEKKRLINEKIGQKIKQIRKSWGFSQIELAEKVGVSFQQIQKYEKGSTQISVARLQQIADVLGVNISDFLEERKKISQVSDYSFTYIPEGNSHETVQSLNKEEMTLLKLFRKTKNRKIKEGIIKQLRGIIEIEKR